MISQQKILIFLVRIQAVFEPRKPFTRSQLSKGGKLDNMKKETENKKQPIMEEIIELSLAEAEITKWQKGKEKFQEKYEVGLLRKKLKESIDEVLEAKLEMEDFKQERKELTYFKKEVNKQIYFYDEVAERSRKMLRRTLTLHRIMKHALRRNRWLQK